MADFEPCLDLFVECIQDKVVPLEDKNVDRMLDLCKRGNLKLLSPLIQRSNDKNPGDKLKYTILHCAAEHSQLEIVQYLLPLFKPKVAELCLLLIQLEDLRDEVKAGVRNQNDLPAQEEDTEKL